MASTHFNAGVCSTGSAPSPEPSQVSEQPQLSSPPCHFSFSVYGLLFRCSAMNRGFTPHSPVLLTCRISEVSFMVSLTSLETDHSWGSDYVTDDMSFAQDLHVPYLAICLEYGIKSSEVVADPRQWGRRENSKVSLTGTLNPLVMNVPMSQDKELTPKRFSDHSYKMYLLVLNGD